jgi:hypothetical protein
VRDAFRVKPKLIYWQISSAVPQHSGRYRCLATNSEGKTLTREAFVEVRLPPTSQRLRAAFFDVPTQHSGKKRISSLFFFRNWITTLCFSYDVASMKQALLIGNWTYDAHGLRKVRADVKTLHDILYKMEFEVISLCNLGKVEILHAADRLCELLLPE